MSGSLYINNKWIVADGEPFSSVDPSSGQAVWMNRAANHVDVDHSVMFARRGFESWSRLSLDERAECLIRFARRLRAERESMALIISRETGKPLWESGIEVESMANKVAISIDAQKRRRSDEVTTDGNASSATRYRPHGVMAVLGPFNFPGHLPNGHIVPALLAGNSVVFKASELAPGVAQRTLELWQQCELPPGVINLLQGGREVGELLINHADINGVCFTGSFEVGRTINRALADRPGVIVALEMGGNNPLIVDGAADVDAAAYWTIQSAFISAGQRCSCARRLIVPRGSDGDAFLEQLIAMAKRIVTGRFDAVPAPFMGPVIGDSAAKTLLDAQADLLTRGAAGLLEMRSLGPTSAMLSPGIIDVTKVADRADHELFGPFLQVIRVDDFDAAIIEANHTRFGLAAGLFCDDRAKYETFLARSGAGIVNWNRALTGASSALPFGGIGDSGNGRPSAYFAADYCSYPVASMEVDRLAMPEKPTPGIL